jgi:hypothetical protein
VSDHAVWTWEEAADRLVGPTTDLEIGVLRGGALLVVADAHRLPVGAAATLDKLDVVAVGLAPDGDPAPGFDVVTDDEAVVESVARTTGKCPIAAVTCCQVLRRGEGAPTGLGLLLESTAYGSLQAGNEFARWLAGRTPSEQPAWEGSPVVVSSTDSRTELTLNRPTAMNAYSATMRDALVEALRGLASDGDDRPILITGAGGAFCTGGDLAEFGSIDNPATAHLIRSAANAAPWFDRLADRITVRVHGAAVGAGAELAAFAGRVEATADAWFSLPEVGMGLIPGAGGTVSIPRRVGRQRAARMCLTGERLDAPTAVAWGLVDELVA